VLPPSNIIIAISTIAIPTTPSTRRCFYYRQRCAPATTSCIDNWYEVEEGGIISINLCTYVLCPRHGTSPTTPVYAASRTHRHHRRPPPLMIHSWKEWAIID